MDICNTLSVYCIKFKYPNINNIYVPNNCYIAAWNTCLMEYNICEIK